MDILEGSIEWYKEHVNLFQDWLLDECCDTDNEIEKQVYRKVIDKSIDMLDCIFYKELFKSDEEMDDWL